MRAPLANRDVRVQHAVGADRRAVADHHVGMNDGASADAGAGADHRERADRRRGIDGGVRRDRGQRVNARRHAPAPATAPARLARTSGTGSGCGSPRTARRQIASPFMITALALVRRELRGVLGIGEKRQVAGAGVLDLRHAADLDGGIALDRAVQAPSQLAEGHGIENITASA